jgi:hypothetical protein
MLDVTEVESPGASGTRWRLPVLAGIQVTMLLSATALAVFKPGRAHERRPTASLTHDSFD